MRGAPVAERSDKNAKLVRILQIAAFAFMLAMLALCVWFLAKNHISVK